MAGMDRIDVLKPDVRVLSVSEYCKELGNGLTVQALYYAMENELVDFVQFGGREKYIVVTAKTLQYVPNDSPKRKA